MDIVKSSRHSKITGDFGEALILYWLSKYGFECARVDHTGIDLIASNPYTSEVMGISVKSRSRSLGKEGSNVVIDRDNFEKVEQACAAFGCVPYFAIVVDGKDVIHAFVISLKHLVEHYPAGIRVSNWRMNEKSLVQYYSDPEVKIFELRTSTKNWWSNEPPVLPL